MNGCIIHIELKQIEKTHPCPAWEALLLDGMTNPAHIKQLLASFAAQKAAAALKGLIEKHGLDYGLVWVERFDEFVSDDPSEDPVFIFPHFLEGLQDMIAGHRDVSIGDALKLDDSVTE